MLNRAAKSGSFFLDYVTLPDSRCPTAYNRHQNYRFCLISNSGPKILLLAAVFQVISI